MKSHGIAGVSEQNLNVAAWLPASTANGPGHRFVIWLQGCPFRCPGCFNPDFLPFVPRHIFTVPDMLTLIMRSPGIEGVTYTGGEPMAQAGPLLALSRQLRTHDLSVVSYTGYTYEELLSGEDSNMMALVECLDILIDGRYEQENSSPLLWRGSANQRVIFLSDRYAAWADIVDRPLTEVELFVGDQLTITGVWDGQFLQRVLEYLKRGIGPEASEALPCLHSRPPTGKGMSWDFCKEARTKNQ